MEKQIRILQKKVSLLETLAANVPAGILLCDYKEGLPIRYISESFTALIGYSLEELETIFHTERTSVVFKDDMPFLEHELIKKLQKEKIISYECRMIRKDGNTIRVQVMGQILHLETGETVLQCILTDITARKNQEVELEFNEKRYNIAMELSGITMFEYDIVTRELFLYENTAKMYRMQGTVPNGPNTLIENGIIEPESTAAYLEMYKKIHAGEPTASCYIKTRDADGVVHDFQLILTSIFDSDGNPVRAIGVRKNMYEILALQKEKDFGKNLMRDKIFIFEADVSNDRITYLHDEWQEKTGLADKISMIQLVTRVSELVAPENKNLILEKLFPEKLKAAFMQGSPFVFFDYQFFEPDGSSSWYEAFVSIIKDRASGNIKARFYHTDVSDKKLKAQRMLAEKQIYESVISQVKLAFEINVTRNLVIRGNEKLFQLYDFLPIDDYDNLIQVFAKKEVYTEDIQSFKITFCCQNLLQVFKSGQDRACCEYRRIENKDTIRWEMCTLHLYEDPETSEIKGFAYVSDIDEEKRVELALKYDAEHDAMTNVYNKATTEKKIDEYLSTCEGGASNHALLIIDIDYFKNVNDTFGHQFGDEVIIEIAQKIRSFFRKHDIIGRVGGDEFCVFMKKVESDRIVRTKAAGICKKIFKKYVQEEKNCVVSASVGASIYGIHGKTYEELFRKADRALYLAKKNGRNRHEFFQDE